MSSIYKPLESLSRIHVLGDISHYLSVCLFSEEILPFPRYLRNTNQWITVWISEEVEDLSVPVITRRDRRAERWVQFHELSGCHYTILLLIKSSKWTGKASKAQKRLALCNVESLSHTYRMTLSGQCRLSVGFKALQVVCGGGAVWQLLGRGESQSSDVSSAMSSDCVSDISRSLRMLSGWARVTSWRPSLSDIPGDRPRGESTITPLLRELLSWGSSPELGAMADSGRSQILFRG